MHFSLVVILALPAWSVLTRSILLFICLLGQKTCLKRIKAMLGLAADFWQWLQDFCLSFLDVNTTQKFLIILIETLNVTEIEKKQVWLSFFMLMFSEKILLLKLLQLFSGRHCRLPLHLSSSLYPVWPARSGAS